MLFQDFFRRYWEHVLKAKLGLFQGLKCQKGFWGGLWPQTLERAHSISLPQTLSCITGLVHGEGPRAFHFHIPKPVKWPLLLISSSNPELCKCSFSLPWQGLKITETLACTSASKDFSQVSDCIICLMLPTCFVGVTP